MYSHWLSKLWTNQLYYLSNEFKGTWESYSRIWFCILQNAKGIKDIDKWKLHANLDNGLRIVTFSRYISKNLFFAASVLNPLTPLTLATPPKKFASPKTLIKLNGKNKSFLSNSIISYNINKKRTFKWNYKLPVPMNGTKSSTVTATPISAKTSTAAILEGSSLLHNTPSISKSTAETFPHGLPASSETLFSFCSTFTHAFTTILRVKVTPFDLHWKSWTEFEMGFGPFGLKKKRDVGRDREAGGDSSFMAVGVAANWLEERQLVIWS